MGRCSLRSLRIDDVHESVCVGAWLLGVAPCMLLREAVAKEVDDDDV